MDAGKRDVVCRRDGNGVCNLTGGKPEELPRASRDRYRELSRVVEPLRHHGHCGRESTLNLVRNGKRQYEFFAGRSSFFGRRENGTEVVTGMTEAAIGHVAVEKIDVARKGGVEECRLIRRGFAATDQGAATWRAVFFELFAQCLERSAWQRRDRAAETIKDIALVKLPDFWCQAAGPGRSGERGYVLDSRSSLCFLPRRLWLCYGFTHSDFSLNE